MDQQGPVFIRIGILIDSTTVVLVVVFSGPMRETRPVSFATVT
jgi:hypothetical protein